MIRTIQKCIGMIVLITCTMSGAEKTIFRNSNIAKFSYNRPELKTNLIVGNGPIAAAVANLHRSNSSFSSFLKVLSIVTWGAFKHIYTTPVKDETPVLQSEHSQVQVVEPIELSLSFSDDLIGALNRRDFNTALNLVKHPSVTENIVNKLNKLDLTPLWCVVGTFCCSDDEEKQLLEVVKALIDKGAQANYVFSKNKNDITHNAFVNACKAGNILIAEYLYKVIYPYGVLIDIGEKLYDNNMLSNLLTETMNSYAGQQGSFREIYKKSNAGKSLTSVQIDKIFEQRMAPVIEFLLEKICYSNTLPVININSLRSDGMGGRINFSALDLTRMLTKINSDGTIQKLDLIENILLKHGAKEKDLNSLESSIPDLGDPNHEAAPQVTVVPGFTETLTSALDGSYHGN
ncbi:hypothetical protein KG892_02875 [Vermiphilus pyriformis]|nr:MAG: hypothetical protein KG892_02875 [Vermiphilus pyriformis]